MKAIRISIPVLMAICCLFASGCSQPTDTGKGTEEAIYSNSFESPADTVGWTGYGAREFRNDVPPNSGKQSLFVSGGCIVPHAAFRIGRIHEESRFILRCWGRNLSNSGVVSLGLDENPFSGIGVTISDTIWTFYVSSDTLFCPTDSSLWLTMLSGGFIPSAMLVDKVEVVKVN